MKRSQSATPVNTLVFSPDPPEKLSQVHLEDGKLVFPDFLLLDLGELQRQVISQPEILAYLLDADPQMANAILADTVAPLTELFSEKMKTEAKNRNQLEEARIIKATHSSIKEEDATSGIRDAVTAADKIIASHESENTILKQRHASRIQSLGSSALTRPSLYVSCSINGRHIQGLIDTGAEMCMMSSECAKHCFLTDIIDKSVTGKCNGMGSAEIIGQVHKANLSFPSITQSELKVIPISLFIVDHNLCSPFIIGLNALWRHSAVIDLAKNTVSFSIKPRNKRNHKEQKKEQKVDEQFLTVPFEVRRIPLETIKDFA